MKPVILPIEDTLDLHTFRPEETEALLDDYFAACIASGVLSVRIIHGKGRGVLKHRVLRLLGKDPRVASFRDAPLEAGSWGATLVELKRE